MSSVTADPVLYEKVINRLAIWTPKFESGYDPGWEYQNPLDEQARLKIVIKTCKELLVPLQQHKESP